MSDLRMALAAAIEAVEARTTYGMRLEPCKKRGYYALAWSNAGESWRVWHPDHVRIGCVDGMIEVDANIIVIRAKNLAQAEEIAKWLPPLPLYRYSSEARQRGQAGAEEHLEWVLKQIERQEREGSVHGVLGSMSAMSRSRESKEKSYEWGFFLGQRAVMDFMENPRVAPTRSSRAAVLASKTQKQVEAVADAFYKDYGGPAEGVYWEGRMAVPGNKAYRKPDFRRGFVRGYFEAMRTLTGE